MKTVLKSGVRISREEIVSLPLFHYTGQVTLIRSENELADALPRLKKLDVVGFDTETRPSFRKGKINLPTLVQMASSEEVFLVHLGWLSLGEALVSVFEDGNIIKAGVAIDNDFRYLEKLYPFTVRGTLDLGEAAKRQGIEIQSLRGLAAYFLGLHISKTEQCSNWAKKELTSRQIRYAATDAWASFAIYEKMKELGLLEEAGKKKKAKARPLAAHTQP